jgi:hypothetical protein
MHVDVECQVPLIFTFPNAVEISANTSFLGLDVALFCSAVNAIVVS